MMVFPVNNAILKFQSSDIVSQAVCFSFHSSFFLVTHSDSLVFFCFSQLKSSMQNLSIHISHDANE